MQSSFFPEAPSWWLPEEFLTQWLPQHAKSPKLGHLPSNGEKVTRAEEKRFPLLNRSQFHSFIHQILYIISVLYYLFWEIVYSMKQYSSIVSFWEGVIKLMCIYVEGQEEVLHNIDEIVISLFYILCIFNKKIPIYRN